jgi:Flp pilus assembly protein TadG
MKKGFGKAKGQIAVLYAGVIAVLLGAVALGTDVALMYANWERVQKTADSAAVAGANFLSSGMTYGGTIKSGCTEDQGDNAEQAACTYALTNDPSLSPSSVTITEPAGNTLKVVAKETDPYFFAKALNVIPGVSMTTYTVSASGTAIPPGPVGTVKQPPGPTPFLGGAGLFPVGLECPKPCTNLSTLGGEFVHFGTKFVTSVIDCTPGKGSCPADGNWQWLDVSGGTGGGIPVMAAAIEYGASATFSINPPNNQIYPDTGNDGNSSQVKKALADRLAKCSSITDGCNGFDPTDIPFGDPCEIIVPAVDFANQKGKSKPMTIYGFALIYLDKSTTTTTSINGCFVSEITEDTIASSSAPNFGALVGDVLTK